MRVTKWWAAIGIASMLSACSAFGSSSSDTVVPLPARPDGTVSVLLDRPLARISPLTRGVSGDIGEFIDAGVMLNSWGGDRATRYNYQLGNAWNLGRAGAYRNEGVITTDDVLADWLAANGAANVASRVAVPGLGWVARNGDTSTCSFPDGETWMSDGRRLRLLRHRTDRGGSHRCERRQHAADRRRMDIGVCRRRRRDRLPRGRQRARTMGYRPLRRAPHVPELSRDLRHLCGVCGETAIRCPRRAPSPAR